MRGREKPAEWTGDASSRLSFSSSRSKFSVRTWVDDVQNPFGTGDRQPRQGGARVY